MALWLPAEVYNTRLSPITLGLAAYVRHHMMVHSGSMSAPVPDANGAAHGDDDATGLGEPLLANVDSGVHAGALATVVVADGKSKVKKGSVSVKAEAKDRYWVDVQRQPPGAVAAAADPESGGDGGRPLMFREKRVKAALLYPYRALILIRIMAIILFIGWRVKHNNTDVMWFWVTSVIADVWFAFSWLLYQLPKLNPIKRCPDLAALRQHYDDLPDGVSILPGIDVFVTTADPIDEPVLYTMNCVLSILAVDYPIDRLACYLSDDSGTLIQYEALIETASFAALWVPFCRKHSIEPRAPESYFQREGMIYTGRSPDEFYFSDYAHVRTEYEEFKARLGTLDSTIRERSDVYNAVKATEGGCGKATWMANGTQWPGTWVEPAENHKKGHHAGVVEVVLEHPTSGSKVQAAPDVQVNKVNPPLNLDGVDTRLPMLVYMARAKSPSYDHNKKAGNLNAQLRVSALLTNAPFVINFDCDHYINDSQALRAAMCFMLDAREGDDTAFVQFPQRFENVDPTDRYGNHNRVFFDGAMYALNGIQGPSYLGTGCMFRRLALYGVEPPRWRRDDVPVDISSRFGNSVPFLTSVTAALNHERHVTPPDLDDDDSFLAEMEKVVSASFDVGTDWGRGVGYIYEIATEDMVTGFRIHGQGWQSMYCSTMEVDAFRGTAPINLTERLYQVVRWAGGSVEMFFSHNNPLFAGPRLHPMQRTVYLNYNIYPVTSLFLLLYALCPMMWLIPEEILIQRPFTRYVLYLIVIIALIHAIGLLEIRWAGTKWLDWWRNEQFFMIASLSAYPTVLLHMFVKLLTRGKGIRFKVTSKQTTVEDDDDKYAEMYEMRWVPIMIPAAVVLFSNTMAIGVAMGKAVVYGRVWPVEQQRHAALGLVFNLWLMILLQPFALAVIGRWSKRPSILFVLFPVAFVVFAVVYIGVHFFSVKFFPSMEI